MTTAQMHTFAVAAATAATPPPQPPAGGPDRVENHYIHRGVSRVPLTPTDILLSLILSNYLVRSADSLTRARLSAGSPYPEALMLGLVAGGRIFGSESALCRHLSAGPRGVSSLWPQIRDVSAQAHSWVLPHRPPSQDQLRNFRGRLVQRGLLTSLTQDFQAASISLAIHLGSFAVADRGNLADIDPYSVLCGDGTVTARYGVVEVVGIDPDTGQEILHGTRVGEKQRRRPARIQRFRTATEEDDKAHLAGINTVHLGVMSPVGYLVLTCRQAPGAESHVAMDLIDEVLGHLPTGSVHALAYDRAITGWHLEYLAGRYALPTVARASAKSGKKPARVLQIQDTITTSTRDELTRRARAAGVRRRELRPAQRAHAVDKVMAELFGPGGSLADQSSVPGITVRHDSAGIPEFVYSVHAVLGAARHQDATGEECEHPLVVDDGALTVLDDRGGKAGHPRLVSAEAIPDGTSHRVRARWAVPCSKGDFLHEEEWVPRTIRDARTRREQARLKGRALALANLRLIPQADGRWARIAGLRNAPESWHNTYKATLAHQRASTPDAGDQLLQYIGAALAYNATRLHRHREWHDRLA